MLKGEYMKRKTTLILALIFAVCQLGAVNAAEKSSTSSNKRLVFTSGSVLNVYFEGQYREIKRAEFIYGYGWLDDHRVFVAYQKERGEAAAELEVIDLRQSRTTKLASMGGVGESYFDVNSYTGEIVYNDLNGIHLLKINPITNDSHIEDIKKNINCYSPFWVDSKTVGCLVYKDGKAEFVKFLLPQVH